MASAFSLSLYPVLFWSQYRGDGQWNGTWETRDHRDPQEESQLPQDQLTELLALRNAGGDFPLINYTSQYGLGCFEGLKAYPQKDGGLKLFRPQANAERFFRSMEGLKMAPYPVDDFVDAAVQLIARNKSLGFFPSYDSHWEKDSFISASSVYLRPFSMSEGGIGLNLSSNPYVIFAATPVGAYFDPSATADAVTTNKIRSTPHGTGWIKCNANYVIPTLAKKEAIAQGYMEAIFLDYKEQKWVEEGSSCNIFFYLKNGTLVTPALEDRVLDGINRRSVLELAAEKGIATEERAISIEEAMDDSAECFVTGTAAGVSYLSSITHQGKKAVFGDGSMGPLTTELLKELKGIQYGALEDRHGWMVTVPEL